MAGGQDRTQSASADIGTRVTKGAPAGGAGNGNRGEVNDGAPVALPLSFVPPTSAQFFTVQGEVDSGIIENAIFAETFRVPEQNYAVVKTLEFFATTADATVAGFTFTLLVGGNAVPGFEGVTIPQVGGTQGVKFDPAFIRIPPTQLISVRRINPTGNAHHVGFFLHGWVYPISSGV